MFSVWFVGALIVFFIGLLAIRQGLLIDHLNKDWPRSGKGKPTVENFFFFEELLDAPAGPVVVLFFSSVLWPPLLGIALIVAVTYLPFRIVTKWLDKLTLKYLKEKK